jgi:hypothetical protein
MDKTTLISSQRPSSSPNFIIFCKYPDSQVFVNDFNASVPFGTIIEHGFLTTMRYASVRVELAMHEDRAQWVYLEVDDFAAACAVLCEHAGILLPRDAFLRVPFAVNALPAAACDPFHRFLTEFHHVLSSCITRREISEAESQRVRDWVRERLLLSPKEALDHYSSSA